MGDQVGVRVAPYSKLAAATISFEGQDTICVYYQTTEKHGPVHMISQVPGNSWTELMALLQMLASLRDPPLYGTSLTALKPRPGITLEPSTRKDSKMTAEQSKTSPVVYLQWDTNALAYGQGKSKISHRFRNMALLNLRYHSYSSYSRPRGVRTLPAYQSFRCGRRIQPLLLLYHQ